MAEKNYWQWFCSSLFYAPGLEHKLLEKYGTPERVFHSKEQELRESFPSNQEKLTILAVNRKKWDFNREAERLQRLNLTFLSIEDENSSIFLVTRLHALIFSMVWLEVPFFSSREFYTATFLVTRIYLPVFHFLVTRI